MIEVGHYSAVIFDLFGTLVPAYRHPVVLAEMAAALRLDTAVFSPAFAEETRDARETGKVTLTENLRAICAALGLRSRTPRWPEQLLYAEPSRRELCRPETVPSRRSLDFGRAAWPFR